MMSMRRGPAPSGRLVPGQFCCAVSLHFGALLNGPGALQVTRPGFGAVDETVPMTEHPCTETLADEPRALVFRA